MSAIPSFTWEEALSEFGLHLQATRAQKTARYYTAQLAQLVKWVQENQIPLDAFGKRHMDRFLVFREQSGKSRMTMRYDALCAKVFLARCVKNDILERSNLAEYHVRNAPRPPKHMPTDQEMKALLQAARNFWDPAYNPGAHFQPPTKRAFHRDRNYTVLLGLVDSACRIGEMLSLKVSDWRPDEDRITIRMSKGREPRQMPVSPEWAEAIETWLKIRPRVMAGAHCGLSSAFPERALSGTRIEDDF